LGLRNRRRRGPSAPADRRIETRCWQEWAAVQRLREGRRLRRWQIIEIVVHAGLNTLTGYLNKVADTDIDFPAIKARKVD
jgi:hypothetical protein